MKPCVADYLSNIKQQINEVSVEDLKTRAPEEGALVIDVREPGEAQQGMVAGAVNIPRGVLEFKLFAHDCVNGLCDEDLFNKPIYLYCASGGRSACCANALQQLGFNKVYSVDGGYKKWVESGGDCVQP